MVQSRKKQEGGLVKELPTINLVAHKENMSGDKRGESEGYDDRTKD